jgi:hypothetical protein
MSLNLQDILPANSDTSEWIVDDDALISNLQAWSMDNKEDQNCNQGNERNGASQASQITRGNGLKKGEDEQSVASVRRNNGGFGSEEFDVCHVDVSLIEKVLHV